MKLYYHKTDGGAEYLFDTFIECENGHKEGCINDQTKYVVRIDGNIRKDAELDIRDNSQDIKIKYTKLGISALTLIDDVLERSDDQILLSDAKSLKELI